MTAAQGLSQLDSDEDRNYRQCIASLTMAGNIAITSPEPCDQSNYGTGATSTAMATTIAMPRDHDHR